MCNQLACETDCVLHASVHQHFSFANSNSKILLLIDLKFDRLVGHHKASGLSKLVPVGESVCQHFGLQTLTQDNVADQFEF